MRLQALRARPRRRRLPSDRGERQATAVAPNMLARRLRSAGSQPKIDCRFYLYLDGRRLGACRCRRRSVLPACGGLVDERHDDGAVRHRCAHHGDLGAGVDLALLLLHHSDRGSQYTSEQFQRLIADHGVTCAMIRSGNCWDNAAMESLFSLLKTERTARKIYRTRDQARADVFDYIERFYNPETAAFDPWISEPYGVRIEG